MSDPVTVSENDNTNPDVDNLASVTTESHTIICDSTLDDDFFVCRKCNKVFKDLSEYLEHKIKDENYKLSHTRSKVHKKMVIPQLVEKKKSVVKKESLKDQNVDETDDPDKADKKVEPNDSAKDNQDDHLTTSTMGTSGPKKRGRKRKAEKEIPEPLPSLGKENSCHLCNQKFRRAATLRWHLKYDHKEKEDNSEDSDTTDNDPVEMYMDVDVDYAFTVVENDGHLQKDKNLIDGSEKDKCQPQPSQPKTTVIPGRRVIKKDSKSQVNNNEETENRPYVCDICERTFKELPIFKAHALVHSKERNFVCTVEGCPYGFKTKGGLVRHMRRHTGERPYDCEKCGRAFAESGALNRHLKARRNCAQTPDTHYPRYRKKWSYHPNIEAVVDQTQREAHIGDPESLDSNLFPHGEAMQLSSRELIESANSVSVVYETEKLGNMKSAIIMTEEWPLNTVKTENSDTDEMNIPDEVPEPGVNVMAAEIEEREKQEHVQELKSNPHVEFLKETECHVCRKDFQLVEQLELHLRTHLADGPTHCALCHFLAQGREEMRLHILTMHNEYLNDVESAMFTMEPTILKENDTKYKDEKTARREALMAVKQLHYLKGSSEKPGGSTLHPSTTGSLQCLICYRTFKGVNYMRQHMRTHTGDRPFKCPQCDRCFTSKDVLKKHMFVHSDHRDYKCGECGKMFKRLVHVQQHLKTHSKERSYRCFMCEKLFKTHNSLKVHLRTHSNINPYRCQVCSRHFRERGSLQRHMRLHTGEKPYGCPHCNRKFAEQGTLSRHLKAKVPCSATRDSAIQSTSNAPNSTMLAQFSSMVADTQYILPSSNVNPEELEGGNLIVLKTENGESEEIVESVEVITDENTKEEKNPESLMTSSGDVDEVMDENTETLQVYDPSTGESLIITGDKSVMSIVKSQQVALQSMNEGLSLDKLRDILVGAGDGPHILTEEDGSLVTENDDGQIIISEISEEMVISSSGDGEINQDSNDKLEIKSEVKEEESENLEIDSSTEIQIVSVLSSKEITET